jgi:hypothetical protein
MTYLYILFAISFIAYAIYTGFFRTGAFSSVIKKTTIYQYRYKALYAASMLAVLYIAMNSISGSATYSEGYFNFGLVIIFISLGIYFRIKDAAQKITTLK